MMLRAAPALVACALMPGCVAVTVVDTAVSVTTTAVGTAADVTAGVIEGGASLVTGGDDEE